MASGATGNRNAEELAELYGRFAAGPENVGLRFPCHWNREGAASSPGASRRAERRPQSGSRISPSLAAISSGLQRPSALLTPVCVTTFISAMRPPPT